MICVVQISYNILNTKCIKDSDIRISNINLAEFPLFLYFCVPFLIDFLAFYRHSSHVF